MSEENVEVVRLNFVLATATDLWAFRYPEPNTLLMLERAIGGPTGHRHLDAANPAGTVSLRSSALAEPRAVILASEQMDEDRGWRTLEPGEPAYVGPDLGVRCRILLNRPPTHQLRLENLEPYGAQSQRGRNRQPVPTA